MKPVPISIASSAHANSVTPESLAASGSPLAPGDRRAFPVGSVSGPCSTRPVRRQRQLAPLPSRSSSWVRPTASHAPATSRSAIQAVSNMCSILLDQRPTVGTQNPLIHKGKSRRAESQADATSTSTSSTTCGRNGSTQ